MSSGSELDADGLEGKLENIEQKATNTKLIRILTVLGYVICVSSAGIVLSLYYIFLWDPYSSVAVAEALTSEKHAMFAALTRECTEHVTNARQLDAARGDMDETPPSDSTNIHPVNLPVQDNLSGSISNQDSVYVT